MPPDPEQVRRLFDPTAEENSLVTDADWFPASGDPDAGWRSLFAGETLAQRRRLYRDLEREASL